MFISKFHKGLYSIKRTCEGPLSGIRVLDLSHTLSGPMATMILGDYGAEVIKIERPGSGDETRTWGPPFVTNSENGAKESAYFMCLNRNKKSVTVNIKDPKGQLLMHELIKVSDVFIANFPAGKLDKYNLNWDSLKEINERLVYVNITGYGQDGPYSQRPAYDLIMEGESGLTDLVTRLANSKSPLTAGLPVADIFTALYSHGAVMAGLLQRDRTGLGVYLETSLFESQLAALSNFASNVLLCPENGSLKRLDESSHHPTLTPYQPFPAKGDVFFNIAALNNEQFRKLCHVLRHKEWADDSKFQNNAGRTKHREELVDLISKETRREPVNYWIKELNAVGVPCGQINTIKEALDHPQIDPCGMIQKVQHSTLGNITMVGPAVKVNNSIVHPFAPPTLGQDTRIVLRTLLKKSDAEIEALYSENVI